MDARRKKKQIRITKKKGANALFSWRVNIVFFALTFFLFLPLLMNLFYLQVVRGDFFREETDGQYVGSADNFFDRGKIFFSGRGSDLVLAAGQEKGYKLGIDVQHIERQEVAEIFPLLKKYGIKKNNIESLWNQIQKMKSRGTKYYELIHKIPYEEKETILKNIKGKKHFRLYSERWRVYPLEESASQDIGFLAYGDDGEYRGRYGLEKTYEKILRRDTKDVQTNIFAVIFHNIQSGFGESLLNEGDVITNIDPQIQIKLESEISSIQKKWKSQLTGGIVMDPKTGKVYALASVPTFNPNHYGDYPISSFRNAGVSNHYEFGSVMKPLVMAIALDKGYVNEKTSYFDKGTVVVGKHTISNFDKRGRGWVTMQDVLNQSLNTGMVFVSKKIPKSVFRDYFEKYGFREKSGIDLPNDANSLSSNLKSNRDIEFANMSFGQGIAISPVSFIKAASALANRGLSAQPHLAEKIRYNSGIDKLIEFPQGRRVIREGTADTITRMLVNVFDHYHNGKMKFPHYSIAAKTGTAQMANPKGGYYEDKHLHSFLAYFPAYNPKFIVFLYTVDPKGVKYSSQTLIEPFRDLARFLIHYYEIPPDR